VELEEAVEGAEGVEVQGEEVIHPYIILLIIILS
jgi:hypothetical protein